MRMLKEKISAFFWAALVAYGLYGLSILIYLNTLAHGLLVATFLNFAMIIFFIVLEKVETYFADKLTAKYKNGEKKPVFVKIFLWYSSGISFKTALYLFYIYILVCTAINAVEPGFVREGFVARFLRLTQII